MSVARQILKASLSLVCPRSLFLMRGPRDCGGIALTFDDGPHPEETPRLLDMLHAHHISATFFVIGREAEKYPGIIRRIVAEGHDLGTHTYSHGEPAATSARELREELDSCQRVLEDITGQTTNLFRPPYGKLSLPKLCKLWCARQTVVLWNVDPRDFAAKSPDEIPHWCAEYQPAAGDVLLFHDNHPHATQGMWQLSERVRARGLEFVRLTDWLRTCPDFRPSAHLDQRRHTSLRQEGEADNQISKGLQRETVTP